MSSDVPSSTRPDPEVGPPTPEHDPSEDRVGRYDAEIEEGGSAGDDLAAKAEGSEEPEPREERFVGDDLAAGAGDSEELGESREDEPDASDQPRESEAVAAESDPSEDPSEPDGLAYGPPSSESAAQAAHVPECADDPSEPEDRDDDADPSDAAEHAPYGAEPGEDPSEADRLASDHAADPTASHADDYADDYDDDADLLDVDLPQRRRRPLSGEEAAAALFHAAVILQQAEAELPEPDETDAEPPDTADDPESDYLRSRPRTLSEAEAAVEADAALFHGEAASPDAVLFDADAEPPDTEIPDDSEHVEAEAPYPAQDEAEPTEAETLLFEAESALFRAEVALAEHEADLVAAAWDARTRAVCRYSGFAVGAALLDVHGRRFTGANVENASYNLGLCAERVALYHALTHGAGRFVAVAIVTEAPMPTSPCGACRQALWEFAQHAEILLVTRNGHQRLSMRDLLPYAFDHETLRAAGTAADDPAR